MVFADLISPGGKIYLHGDCVSVGCLPLTDAGISELYVYAVEAKNAGQDEIPITILPFRNTHPQKSVFEKEVGTEIITLWKELTIAEKFFDENRIPPRITTSKKGRHLITKGN